MNDPRNPGPGSYSPTPGMSPTPRLPSQPPHAPQHGPPSGVPRVGPYQPVGAPGQAMPRPPAPAQVGPAAIGRPATVDESIALDDLPPQTPAHPAPSKIKAFGVDAERRREDWKRKTHTGGQHCCRVRSFHGKYSDQGLAHMDDLINEWLDAHPEVEVKFITSTVGVFEGKIREPALVLNIWY